MGNLAMAKRTEDREDLLRDGTAMPVRARMWVGPTEVVLGFRPAGQLSLYWGQDPVFQFNEKQQLRRVFIDAQRLAAQQGRLAVLSQPDRARQPPVDRLRLVAQPVSDSEQRRILQRAAQCLQQIDLTLRQAAESEAAPVLETVGASSHDFAQRFRRWLDQLDGAVSVAETPAA
jgi:hypothetical protein